MEAQLVEVHRLLCVYMTTTALSAMQVAVKTPAGCPACLAFFSPEQLLRGSSPPACMHPLTPILTRLCIPAKHDIPQQLTEACFV